MKKTITALSLVMAISFSALPAMSRPAPQLAGNTAKIQSLLIMCRKLSAAMQSAKAEWARLNAAYIRCTRLRRAPSPVGRPGISLKRCALLKVKRDRTMARINSLAAKIAALRCPAPRR